MNANEKDIRLLEMISNYCDRIDSTVNRFGNNFSKFANDSDYMDSVCMNILQIGELAGKLSEVFVQKTKGEIDWRNIKGMRNLFAHAYGSMDINMIWETVQNDIPTLKSFCEQLVHEINANQYSSED